MLLLQGARVRSLMGQLRFHKLYSVAKIKAYHMLPRATQMWVLLLGRHHGPGETLLEAATMEEDIGAGREPWKRQATRSSPKIPAESGFEGTFLVA